MPSISRALPNTYYIEEIVRLLLLIHLISIPINSSSKWIQILLYLGICAFLTYKKNRALKVINELPIIYLIGTTIHSRSESSQVLLYQRLYALLPKRSGVKSDFRPYSLRYEYQSAIALLFSTFISFTTTCLPDILFKTAISIVAKACLRCRICCFR